jgi:hypothetical protein
MKKIFVSIFLVLVSCCGLNAQDSALSSENINTDMEKSFLNNRFNKYENTSEITGNYINLGLGFALNLWDGTSIDEIKIFNLAANIFADHYLSRGVALSEKIDMIAFSGNAFLLGSVAFKIIVEEGYSVIRDIKYKTSYIVRDTYFEIAPMLGYIGHHSKKTALGFSVGAGTSFQRVYFDMLFQKRGSTVLLGFTFNFKLPL